MEWRSIDSAPKDGTPILCYSFDEDDEHEPIHVVKWFANDWVCQVDMYYIWRPSYWMPLPIPPEKKHRCENYRYICETCDGNMRLYFYRKPDCLEWSQPLSECPFCGEKA